jgi:hypothetical protein
MLLKGKKNKKAENLLLRNLCENFILFNYSIIIKQTNPLLIVMPIMFSIMCFQSFYLLKLYIALVFISAAFMDICYKIPSVGYPVCYFLKRHASPEIFALIGNSPFEAFFAKISGPALKSAALPATKIAGAALVVDYVASTSGAHQLSGHMLQDFYNGEKTVYKHDPKLDRQPYFDILINSKSNSN